MSSRVVSVSYGLVQLTGWWWVELFSQWINSGYGERKSITYRQLSVGRWVDGRWVLKVGGRLGADGVLFNSNSKSEMCMGKVLIVIGRGFSLKLKGEVHASCVRKCLIYGSET